MKEKNQEFKSAQGSFPVVHLFDLTSTASTSFFLFRLAAFKRNPIDIQMWALAGSNARRS